MEDRRTIVTIDGPAGAGKSTVARRVAAELGYRFLDTGAMYRAATWRAVHAGVDLDDPEALAASTRAMRLEMPEGADGVRVVVDGHDITHVIRTPEITRVIWKVDQVPAVRERLVELQRAFGHAAPTVAEGRDMGTVVFPQAACKVFLDASLDARTHRRAAEMRARGLTVDVDALRAEIHERDEKTRTRKTAPLRPAADAHLLDTTDLSIEQVVSAICGLARDSA